MASRLPQIGVSLAETNRQLKEQNAKLIPEVKWSRAWRAAAHKLQRLVAEQRKEIERNRETIRVQGERILELERELQALRAAHRTVDPAQTYVVLDAYATAVPRRAAAALALPDYDDDRR